MGGKSKSQTIGYKYYVGMHQILCQGPVDYISEIKVDDRLVWSGEGLAGQISIEAEEVFGGSSREGGVSGLVDIEMGDPAQVQNDYLVTHLGADIPAHRGVLGAVLRGVYCGNNPYLKPWKWRAQRIHVRQDGVAQWYDAKAEIPDYVDEIDAVYIYIDAVLNAGTTTGAAFTNGVSFTPEQDVTIYPTTYNHLTGLNETGVWAVGNGSENARFWYFTDNDEGTATSHDAGTVRPTASESYGLRTPLALTGGVTYTFGIVDAGGFMDNEDGIPFVVGGASTGDMNPAHIIRECLTDPDWGMGYSEDDIDDTSFMASADTLWDEGLGMSLLWDKQIKIEDFIGEIIKHIDAVLYVSRVTGKFVLKLIRADYTVGSLITLDESNISKVTNPSRTAFDELANSVTVNYWNSADGVDASLTVTDPAMVQQQGLVINTTMQYPGFTNPRNASIVGQRDLKALSSSIFSCTVLADETANTLEIGDVFKLSWDKWFISDMVMRITGISFGDGRNNQVKITCAQDVFSTPSAIVVNSAPTEWANPSSPPGVTAAQIAFEAPYLELVQAVGQTDADAELTATPDVGFVMVAASRATSAINARMWTDAGSGYAEAATFDFCPTASLSAAITKTQASFTVTNMNSLALVTLGSHVQIDDELLRVDSLDTTTGAMTVGRGVLDTVPEAHSASATLFFWDEYSGVSETDYVDGETIGVKVTPISGAGVLPIADAVEVLVTLDSRAFRPYAPGDLKVDGDSYLDLFYQDTLTLTWAHRDRTLQTSGILVDHTEASIGPETDTLYRLQGYIDGTLVHTEDDIAGATVDWLPSEEGIVKVEVHSKRDSLYSWQAPWHQFYYTVSDVLLTEEGDERYTEEGILRVTED